MIDNWHDAIVDLAYLVSAVTFIFGLKFLSTPVRARRGNQLATVGMIIAVIATLAIPTSIIPTFAFMYYMGFTLNNITMLGLILAIGIVIDDAVVVHENIFRLMEEKGLDGMQAARQGTREIALPVMATSLSLVVIFVPLAFMGGVVGRFFSSFGLTVAFAVMMSLFVSFTLTPMLCSRFLKLEPSKAGHAKSKSGLIYRAIDGAYGRILRFALAHKLVVIGVTVLVILSTVPIGRVMGVSLIPATAVADLAVLLASDKFRYTTGDILTVDGGLAEGFPR